MQISIDGLRKSATRDTNELGEIIKTQILTSDIDEWTASELISAFNRVAQSVGIFNCVYMGEVEDDFNDLSEELSVEFLEGDE